MRLLCIQPDCYRVRGHGSGNCTTHERRRVRGEPMDTPIRIYYRMGSQGEPVVRQCVVIGCSRKHRGRGRCSLHYRRLIERERGGLGNRAWKKLNG